MRDDHEMFKEHFEQYASINHCVRTDLLQLQHVVEGSEADLTGRVSVYRN